MKPISEIETTKGYPITVAVKYYQPSGLADDSYTPEYLVYAKDLESCVAALTKISGCVNNAITEDDSNGFRIYGINDTESYAMFVTPNTDAYLASSFLAMALEHTDPEGTKLLLRLLRELAE
jgi:hypothetical protein